MAFDGFFINKYCKLLDDTFAKRRVDRIFQLDNKDIVISFKGIKDLLLLSVLSSNPRAILINEKPQTPQKPPMFCMLMRKHLQNAVLKSVSQISLERILSFEFDASNQIGDRVNLILRIELMGKHANLMLLDENDQIIDSVKRIGLLQSPRPIAPGVEYQLPPSQKQATLALDCSLFKQLISNFQGTAYKALYQLFEGVSPAISKTLLLDAGVAKSSACDSLSAEQLSELWTQFKGAISTLQNSEMYVYRDALQIIEISAVPLLQHAIYDMRISDDVAQDVQLYYAQTKDTNRIAQKSVNLLKRIDGLISKVSQKQLNLQADIERAKRLDDYKLCGELLTANLHTFKKGDASFKAFNYYDDSYIDIALDVRKSPNDNAQLYYKKYNKAKVTLTIAHQMLEQAEDDIAYLKQVRIMLDLAESAADVDTIYDELSDLGYVRKKNRKKVKQESKLPPLLYRSFEGVDILVGRNNYQNDQLTLKRAHREHIWLHTKDVAGSHVIICAEFADIDERTIVEAAEIAAYHSDARMSSQVPVDLTEVKFVKKPKGAKPGMVIYEDNKTIYVTPDEEKILSMKVMPT